MTTDGQNSVPPHLRILVGMGHSDTGEITFDRLTTMAGSPALELSSEQHSAHGIVQRAFVDCYSAPFVGGTIAALTLAIGDWRTERAFPRISPENATRETGSEILSKASRLDVSALGSVETQASDILNINSHGLGNAVNTVISAIRKFFGDVRLALEWEEGPDVTSPIAITILASDDLEDAYERLDNFDSAWWHKQEPAIHEVVGVYMA